MNVGPFWACPACGTSLHRAHPTWGVFACPRCGGVWTDTQASSALRQAAEASIVSVSALASSRAPGADRAIASEARLCPACRCRLAQSAFAGVTIDYCATHGTWFDRGEIACVVRGAGASRAQATTGNVAAGAAAVGRASWSVLEVCGWVIGSAIEVLADD